MLTTIKGMYDNGLITFLEKPPVKVRSEVIITFLSENEMEQPITKNQIRLGGLEGKINIPADFDEPLEDLKDYM